MNEDKEMPQFDYILCISMHKIQNGKKCSNAPKKEKLPKLNPPESFSVINGMKMFCYTLSVRIFLQGCLILK